MLRIGIIGLGDIAQKAYLPVLSKKDVEIHLHTRNALKLQSIARQYRIVNMHDTLDAMIGAGIQAAFVHTTTASHEELVAKLLNNGVHVLVDKPITYHYSSAEKLMALAKSKKVLLDVGFNRRYSPAIQELKKLDSSMIIMQKNRKALPGDVRTVIFDDFIHVVDTLLYLSPFPVVQLIVNGKKKDNLLYHVVVQITFPDGRTAVGIMNRDSGTVEEKVEMYTSEEKRVVMNVTDSFVLKGTNELKVGANNWESTLHRRGFDNMVNEFLAAVKSGRTGSDKGHLLTHRTCEEIVDRLDRQ